MYTYYNVGFSESVVENGIVDTAKLNLSYAALFSCTAVIQASATMTALT